MLGLLVLPWLLLSGLEGMVGRQLLLPVTKACLGLTAVLLFAGIGHFVLADPMYRLIPAFIPARIRLTYLTGVLEIVAAVLLLVPGLRRGVAVALIIYLIVVFPLNVYAAWRRVPLGGHAWGPSYLLIRFPLQAVLVFWTWKWAVRRG